MDTHSSTPHIAVASEKPTGLGKIRAALTAQGILVGICGFVLIYFLFFHSKQYEEYLLPAAVSLCVGIGLLIGLINLLLLFLWVRSERADPFHNKT